MFSYGGSQLAQSGDRELVVSARQHDGALSSWRAESADFDHNLCQVERVSIEKPAEPIAG